MVKTGNAEFQSVELWFTDQNNRPLEIQDSVNITLIIGKTLLDITMRYLKGPRNRKYVKGYGLLSFARKIGDKYSEKLMDTTTE